MRRDFESPSGAGSLASRIPSLPRHKPEVYTPSPGIEKGSIRFDHGLRVKRLHLGGRV